MRTVRVGEIERALYLSITIPRWVDNRMKYRLSAAAQILMEVKSLRQNVLSLRFETICMCNCHHGVMVTYCMNTYHDFTDLDEFRQIALELLCYSSGLLSLPLRF